MLDVQSPDDGVRACGMLNRDGTLTVGFVNRNREPTEVTLDTDLFRKNVRVYEYDPRHVPYNRFAALQGPSALLGREALTYTLKPESVTYFTTDYLEKTQRVAAGGVTAEPGLIRWNAVTDAHHCYYRVFTGDREDFAPAPENQIASTVATSLHTNAAKRYVKVLSVDKSGNM